MMKDFKYYFLFLIIFINIGKTNTKFKISKIFHPLNIHFDFSNLTKNKNTKFLQSLLKESSIILSKLIYTNNNKKINISEKEILNCKKDIFFKNITNSTFDIVIYPILEKLKKKDNYKIEFCANHKNKMPSIVILTLNEKLNFSFKKNKENAEYKLILDILKMLTDCLGLDIEYLKKKKFLRNNFFETPFYLMPKNSTSFNSINKLYNLTNEKIPEIKISTNGNFYLSKWDKNFIVKDFRNEKSDIKGDISEASMNFFNDMEFYSLNIFDYEYIKTNKKNICYRVDQKCLNESELQKYYINYGLNLNKNNEIVCYLSSEENIKLNQCGIYYSYLIQEKLDFCPLITKDVSTDKIKNDEIPDLIYYHNQTLNLLTPSSKCRKPSPRTIYFKSFQREENLSNIYNIETITLDENQKKFFVTYYSAEEVYFKNYVNILEKNGIIRSYYLNNEHNLYIKSFSDNFLLKNNKKGNYFNDFQKIYHFMGVETFFYKNLLYENYLNMKKYFKAYNYMPKTYEYPKDKSKIEKKFKNYKLDIKDLWIVKPTNLFSGAGIHIFKSLHEEKKNRLNNFIISKYLTNPHLLYGKKYDMRIYVLITGFQPLRIYLYQEGLVRIAADEYNLNLDSIDNKFSHLTNTAINIHNKNYIDPKSEMDESANKWNLKTYRNYLKKQNVDVELLFDKIKDIIIKTFISGQRAIIKTSEKLKLNDLNMFNLFGFDIFIDDKFDPYLLEVNTRPFMHEYNKYDRIIKSNLLVDTLNIAGITLFSHDKKHQAYDNAFNYAKEEVKRVDDALCELTRPRGDYELIFPLKNNIDKYSRFFFYKKGKENAMFWKEIIKD